MLDNFKTGTALWDTTALSITVLLVIGGAAAKTL
jgi:hypothetical protein